MDIEGKMALVLKRPTEEVITEERLRQLFEEEEHPKHYIGYEISGFVHIGTYSTFLKVKDLEEAGFRTTIFLADYHSWINMKLGGDLERIRKVAREYFTKVVELSGLKAEVVLASEIYDMDYWADVIRISSHTTVQRAKRTLTIMGRKEEESIPVSWLIYPMMQAADIFKLGVHLAQAGMDQRKVHMLALEVSEKLNREKPVFLHTHLLPGLQSRERMSPEEGEGKMSKSKPTSALFLHDSEESIRSKIRAAFCPQKEVEGNPVFEILKHVLVREDDKEVTIERDEKYGGDITAAVPELEEMYKRGEIHPLDLKNAVAEMLIEELRVFRDYFSRHSEILELLK